MSTIIDLATFRFNESSLITSIANTKQALIELKAQQTINNNDYKTYQKTIDAQVVIQNKLIASNQQNTQEFKDNANALNLNRTAQQSILQSNTVLANNINVVNNELKQQEGFLKGTTATLSGTATPYKNLNDEMNKLKVEAKNLGAELIILEREGKKGTAEYNALEQQFKATSLKANELNESFKGIDKSVGDNNRNVGNYSESIKEAFNDINIFNGGLMGFMQRSNEAGGVGKLVSGSFAQIGTSVRSASAALLSNPIGVIIAGIVGAFAGFREVLKYNESIAESAKLTEQLTNKTGSTADAIRNSASAFTETFGGEFKENLRTADELVNDFGITYEDAFAIMTDSTIRGANANGEFGESINEYGVFFKKAGFSAQEFANVLNAGVDLGVYSDKLPDAIKEIDLSLREQTKATKEALVGAFGATFTDDVLNRINTGATSTKDAMAEIAKEAERTNLTQVQLATLTADVARGAGEDVGGIAVVFKALNQAVNSNKKPLTDLQKATFEVASANKELQIAKDRALKSDSAVALNQQFSNLGKTIKTRFYNAIANVGEFFTSLGKLQIKVKNIFIDLTNAIPNIFTNSFNLVKKNFNDFLQNFVTGGSLIKNAFTGNFDGVQEDFNKIKKSFLDIKTNIKEGAKSVATDVGITISESLKQTDKMLLDKKNALIAQSKVEAEIAAKESNKGTSQDQVKANQESEKQAIKDAHDRLKQKQDLLKKELEDQKNNALSLANTEIENAKISLNAYLNANQSKLTDAKRLTNELVAEENKRLDAVLEKNRDILTAETRVKNEQLTAEIKALENKKNLSVSEVTNIKDLQLQKNNLQTDYLTKDAILVSENDKVKKTNAEKLENEISEQKKIKQAQEFQLKLEQLELQGATESEIQLAKLDNDTQVELQKFIEAQDLKFQAKVQTQSEQDTIFDEIELAKKELKAELQATDDENEKIRIQNLLDGIVNIEKTASDKKIQISDIETKTKLQAYNRLFGDIAGLFGKETAIAKLAGSAQAGINTYLGATAVLADATVPTFIKPILVGTTIASGLSSIAKINGISGFATGGIITDGMPISRRNGDDVLITAKKNEVILNDIQQIRMGGPSAFAKAGVPGFATGGIVGSNLSSVQNTITNSLDMTAMVSAIGQAVFDGANSGTAQGSQNGIVELSSNRLISNGANF